MTERDDAGTQRGRDARHANDADRDPLLVRPFIGGTSGEKSPSSAARAGRRMRSHRAVVPPDALPGRPVPPDAPGPPDSWEDRRQIAMASAEKSRRWPAMTGTGKSRQWLGMTGTGKSRQWLGMTGTGKSRRRMAAGKSRRRMAAAQSRRRMAVAAGKSRRWVVVAGAGVAAVLVLGTVGFVAMRSGDEGGTDLAAQQTLPVVSPPAAVAGSAGPPASPSALGDTGPPGTREPGGGGRPPRTSTVSASGAGTRASASAGRSGGGNGAPAPGSPAAPRPVDRVGAIGSPGGLCLNLNGGVAADGNFIDVFRCNGTNAQIWTVGTDGTLRVAGKCAQSLAADTAIAVTGCDGRASTRWRAGANGSLVSVNVGQCLADPGNGGTNGEAVRLTACTGNANQRFTLP